MRRNKLTPVPVLVLVDVLLIGASLCVFALFHHVLPSVQQANVSASTAGLSGRHAIVSDGGNRSAPAAAPTVTVDSGTGTGSAAATGSANAVPAGALASGDTDELFTDGDVISTDTAYKSATVSITVSEHDVNGVVYYVQDIYIKNAENLKTAFAQDAYGKGIRDTVMNMATTHSALAAINGDYYGTSASDGVVIRNGVLYRDNPTGDVLVMFYDGRMEVYAAREFDGEKALAAGAYQAWCFGPSLLSGDGKALTSFTVRGNVAEDNPRTGIGYYEPGHYCFVTVDGRSTASAGMSLGEFAALFQALGCKVAYNLDGGKTSVMTFGDAVVNIPDGGGRTSSDIIYISE